MDNQAQAAITPWPVYAVPVVLVVVIVVLQLPEAVEGARAFADWCSAHSGELYNAKVIDGHGGLHCELPNGTVLHADEVSTNG